MRICVLAFLVVSVFGSCLMADTTADHNKHWELWGDISFNTTQLGALSAADVSGRKLLIAGLRYTHPLVQGQKWVMDYTLDLIPFALAFSSEVNSTGSSFVRKNIYGWGASPIGFRFHFGNPHRIQPFFNINGGFLRFDQAVPAPTGTLWNFTASAGGGVRFRLDTHAIDAGYLFHHISNGRKKLENPSLNTQMIYLGFLL